MSPPGRPNPYARRLGAAGRNALVERFLKSERLVRLDEEVAEAFPSGEEVNEALRLVLRLRNLAPRPLKKATSGTARGRRKRARRK